MKASSGKRPFPAVAVAVSLRRCGWTDRREANKALCLQISLRQWRLSAHSANLCNKDVKGTNGRLGYRKYKGMGIAWVAMEIKHPTLPFFRA